MRGTEGSLEIVRQSYQDPRATPRYKVMFNPYKGHRGGAQQGKELTGDAALEAYLTEVDFSKEDIKARMKELKTKASITVPNVFLDKEHLRPFGY